MASKKTNGLADANRLGACLRVLFGRLEHRDPHAERLRGPDDCRDQPPVRRTGADHVRGPAGNRIRAIAKGPAFTVPARVPSRS